jgi:hypothetical protein
MSVEQRPAWIAEMAKDIDFAIDVTEPREVLLCRFEDIIERYLTTLQAEVRNKEALHQFSCGHFVFRIRRGDGTLMPAPDGDKCVPCRELDSMREKFDTLQAEVEAREQAAPAEQEYPECDHKTPMPFCGACYVHDWALRRRDDPESRCERSSSLKEAAEQKIKSLTARAIVAEQHKTLELLSKGSATEQLEMRLREKLAAAELRAEAAEQRITALEGALRAKVAEWRQYIAEEDNDEWGRERASTLSDAADELEALIDPGGQK